MFEEVGGADTVAEGHNSVRKVVSPQPLHHALFLHVRSGSDVDDYKS